MMPLFAPRMIKMDLKGVDWTLALYKKSPRDPKEQQD